MSYFLSSIKGIRLHVQRLYLISEEMGWRDYHFATNFM